MIEQLAAQVATLATRLDQAKATLARLSAYAASSWQSITGNPAETEKRLQFARDAIARGRAALAAKDQRSTGTAIRDAQGAIGEATALLDAVERLSASLDDANTRLPDELAAAATDVASARQAVSVGAPRPDQQQKAADAEAFLAAAQKAAAATPPDVLDAFKNATQANATADAVVAAAKEETARVSRQAAVIDSTIRAAAMAVSHASDYLETRRGGVGTQARTRLVEAQRQLDLANASQVSDPDGALLAAQRAQSIANDAYIIASLDFNQFDASGPPPGLAGTPDTSGTILGGLVAGFLSGGFGGGRRGNWGGGGWGGTPWGSPPGSGSSGNSGSSGGGVFGGLGGSGGGGRSIGGSWGGLGGRSRGGRW